MEKRKCREKEEGEVEKGWKGEEGGVEGGWSGRVFEGLKLKNAWAQ